MTDAQLTKIEQLQDELDQSIASGQHYKEQLLLVQKQLATALTKLAGIKLILGSAVEVA